MPTPPTSADAFLVVVQKSGLVDAEPLRKHVMGLRSLPTPPRSMQEFARTLVNAGLLTDFHIKNMLRGRYKGFVVGKYKVLHPIGSGGMGTVYLCEHSTMRHKVAMKILPVKSTNDQVSVERFFREARAAAGLNHPNIVRAHDIDKQDNLYYIVMDYVEGVSLQDLVSRKGPLDPVRAAHYIAQAALGLQYIQNSGLAHRDIKPGNLLIDREGTLKILDLGLARYLDDRADKLTKQLDEQGILGTADYISPEQAVESHDIDNRTDIYSLGATFYYVLAGRAPFEGASAVQKLMYHQTHEPVKLENLAPGVPKEMADIIRKMMEKLPENRFQLPGEIAEALEPWTQKPIAPPSPDEMPNHGLIDSTEGGDSGTVSGASAASIASGMRRLPKTGSNSYGGSRTAGAKAGGGKGLLIGGAVLAFLAAALGIAYFAGAFNKGDLGKPIIPAKIEPKEKGGTVNKPAEEAKFFVSKAGKQEQAATLAEALAAAKGGGKVVVRGERMPAGAAIPPDCDAEIEGDSGTPGMKVIWEAGAAHPLLAFSNAAGLKLRGFQFDGNGAAGSLIDIQGNCPGMRIEDCEFRNFKGAAIRMLNAAGTKEAPAVLRKVRFTTEGGADAALALDGAAARFIDVTECRFEGGFAAGVKVDARLEDVKFLRDRFHLVANCIVFVNAAAAAGVNAVIENCVFFESLSALRFDGVPGFKEGKLFVRNNLFANPGKTPGKAASIEGVNVAIPPTKAEWIWLKEETIVLGKGVKPGTWYFRKVFQLEAKPAKAVMDIGCDDSFTVWINGRKVGASETKYFTKRVYAYDVAQYLQAGNNIIAVEGVNQLDAVARNQANTAAALMLQVVDGTGRDLVHTDASWKASDEQAEDWNKLAFDDSGWTRPMHVWALNINGPFDNAVWESALEAKSPGLSKPAWLVAQGNVRDYNWGEGAPLLNSIRGSIIPAMLPTDAKDDATFLRYPRNSSLNSTDAVPEGQVIGYPQ